MGFDPDGRMVEDILDEVKRTHQGREVVNVEEEKVKVVIFLLGENTYAFHGRDIKEIISGCLVHPIPSLPEYLPGLINVRGDIESAVDLALLLSGPRQDKATALVAMAEKDGFRAGIVIDAVEDVADVPAASIQPPLATLHGPARDLACGEFAWRGRTATLLDMDKLAAKVTL